MPLLKTTRPCFYVEADAYILIHHGNSQSDFMAKRIFRRAGPQMLEAYNNSGIVPYGDPVITPGFGLKAKYVIHILQPKVWEREPITKEQYKKALMLAQACQCDSVVFSVPSLYEEIEKIDSVCRAFAQKSDMTIFLSKSGDSEAEISDRLLDKLKRFLGVYGEKDLLERSVSSIDPSPKKDVSSEVLSSDDFPMLLEKWTEDLVSPIVVGDDAEDCAFWEEDTTSRQKELQASKPQPDHSLSQTERPKDAFSAIREFLELNDIGFKDALLKYIDRTGKKDSEIYRKANVDRRLFSKIMNVQGYNPSKPTAIAFAIALELNLEETKDLIGRAGYTLSKASTFDRIIEFFILERNYDIYEINEALFYFDQSLLGC